MNYNSIISDGTKINNDHKILDKTNIFTTIFEMSNNRDVNGFHKKNDFQVIATEILI